MIANIAVVARFIVIAAAFECLLLLFVVVDVVVFALFAIALSVDWRRRRRRWWLQRQVTIETCVIGDVMTESDRERERQRERD
jgi:membrane protein implicated in regulation of membrane protease activity